MNNMILMSYYIMGKMRRVYFMSIPENNKDYKKSRQLYTIGDTAAQTIVQLAGGTFLVALMEALNISDGNIGIIASIGSLAAIAQLGSMKLVAHINKNKLFVCLMVLQKFWLAFIFFIPLFDIGSNTKKVLLVVSYCIAQICIQIGTPATIDWIASLIPSKLRGRYFSIKDSIAVFVVVSTTLVMGILVDFLKNTNINLVFIILGIAIAILVFINFISFSKMKEPKTSIVNDKGKELHGALKRREESKYSFKKEIHIRKEFVIALKNKNFIKVLTLNCCWMTAFYVASPFNASYQIKDLSLPYTYIMVLSFATSMLRIYLTPKAGKLADKLSMATVLRWSLIAMGGNYFVMSIAVPGNAYFTAALASLFSSLGWIFIGIGMLGIQLEFLDEEKRIVQFALLSVISGCYGFGISFLAGKLINVLQQYPISLGTHTLYAQQITNSLGVLFILCTVIYLSTKIEKKH